MPSQMSSLRTYLVVAVAWLTVCTETARSSARMRKGSFAEATVVLKRLTILPTEEECIDHCNAGVLELEAERF